MMASYSFDTPTGATIVVIFGFALVLCLLLNKMISFIKSS